MCNLTLNPTPKPALLAFLTLHLQDEVFVMHRTSSVPVSIVIYDVGVFGGDVARPHKAYSMAIVVEELLYL